MNVNTVNLTLPAKWLLCLYPKHKSVPYICQMYAMLLSVNFLFLLSMYQSSIIPWCLIKCSRICSTQTNLWGLPTSNDTHCIAQRWHSVQPARFVFSLTSFKADILDTPYSFYYWLTPVITICDSCQLKTRMTAGTPWRKCQTVTIIKNKKK